MTNPDPTLIHGIDGSSGDDIAMRGTTASHLPAPLSAGKSEAVCMLRANRRGAGITQAQLAGLVGQHPNDLQRIEAGKHSPRVDSLERYANALGLVVTLRQCGCYRCTKAYCATHADTAGDLIFGGTDLRMVRMFCCETCGNKRCPHATDHRHACTGSNKPGQAGSAYE